MSKTVSLDDLLAPETPELRAKIRSRGQALIKAETLRQLRVLASKRQSDVLGMTQDGVSRLESRDDLLLSSLDAYVRGLGGRLKIVAELPQVGAIDLQIGARRQAKAPKAAQAGRPVVPAAMRKKSVRKG